MRHANFALFENLYLLVVDVNDVRGQQPLGKESDPLEIERWTRVISLGDGLCFSRGFGKVSDDRDIVFLCERFDLIEMLRADGVRRVRRDRGGNQGIAFPTL